jgi:hypothetical protein
MRGMARFREYKRPEYKWCTGELTTVAQHLRREAAEADILDTATDPDRDDRIQVLWGGRSVTLQNTDGLYTAYHMRDGDEVSFDLVFDSDPVPEFMSDRAPGSWFDRLDLT